MKRFYRELEKKWHLQKTILLENDKQYGLVVHVLRGYTRKRYFGRKDKRKEAK